jgi:PAS domain S-box-containing protein
VSVGGILIPLPGLPTQPSTLTAVAATFAAVWLTWLEGLSRKAPSATLGSSACLDPQAASRLLQVGGSMLSATDPTQLLEIAAEAMSRVLDVRSLALLLAGNEPPEPAENRQENTHHLRLVAHWPQTSGPEVSAPSTLALSPMLVNTLNQCHIVNLVRKVGDQRIQALESALGAELEAALLVPLLPLHSPARSVSRDGWLVIGHSGAPLSGSQLRLFRTLADQVAVVFRCIQLRAKVGKQAGALVRLARRQEHQTRRSRAILESVADGIIVSDADDQVVLTNSAAADVLGIPRSDILGQPFGQIVSHMAPAGEVGIIGALTEGAASLPFLLEGSSYRTEAVFEVSGRVVQTCIAPVTNSDGTQLGVVAVLRDITALARAEVEREQLLGDLQEHSRQLEEAADSLRELDQLKSQLIANMSHELRTPLNAIIGFSGVMLKGIDGELSEAQREDMEVIYRSGKHLLELITDILDISRLWAGKMDLTLGDVDLPEVIQDAVAIATPLIDEKPIQLVQKLHPDLPTVWTDRTRVRQLLLNLLTNAIKYTEQGNVTVSASTDKGFVVITVADTGIGIPPEHMETIFQEFGRVDNSSTRKTGGLGLGLAISQQLIELLGGQIWVESDVGVGSTFHFSLPIEGPPSASRDQRITRRRLRTALAHWQ